MSSITKKIISIREFFGLNQDDFARLIGDKPNNVDKYEAGGHDRKPSFLYIQRICFRYPEFSEYLLGLKPNLPNKLNSEVPQSYWHLNNLNTLKKPYEDFDSQDFEQFISTVNIGFRLKIWKKRLRLTNKKIAKITGLSLNAVSDNLNKYCNQSYEFMENIINYCPDYALFLLGTFDYVPNREHHESFSRRFRLVVEFLNADFKFSGFAESLEISEDKLFSMMASGGLNERQLQLFSRRYPVLVDWVLNKFDDFPNIEEQERKEKIVDDVLTKVREVFDVENVNEFKFFGRHLSEELDLPDLLSVIDAYPDYRTYLTTKKMPFITTNDQITPREKMLRDLSIREREA